MSEENQASVVDYDPFSGGDLQQVVPITEPQREIWLGDRMGEDASLSFNLSESLRLRGVLDVGALRQALASLVERHDALRASFGPDGETMCIAEHAELPLHTVDLRSLSHDERNSAVHLRLRHQLETPFQLEQGGLFRCELLQLAADEHLLLMTAHHIVCDGWSWSVLVRELGALYGKACGLDPQPLAPADSFADYALQQSLATSELAHAQDEAYWLSRFPGTPPVLDLPTDRPRPQQRSFASARVDHLLDASLVAGLRKLGSDRGASLFATLLAGYSLLVARLAGDDTVVVGIPAAGQAAEGHGALVGHCVNLLPLRFDLDPAQSFGDAVIAAQSIVFDALEHQQYTFGTLLKRLPIARDPGRMPLVGVVLNFEQSPDLDARSFAGLDIELSSNPRSHDPFELFLNVARQRDGALRLECQYNRDCFESTTVLRWLEAMETMLRAAVADASSPVSALSLLDPSACLELTALQPAPVRFEADLRMHEHFERQCDKTPRRIAVSCVSATWTYAELEARANAIAYLLRAQGIGIGDLVGLAVEREPDMIAALLGIQKAGAAYVPLDPGFPQDRLAFMVDDAGLAALVTQRKLVDAFPQDGRPLLVLDDPDSGLAAAPSQRIGRDPLAATPGSPAYVIYTSGSTGRPKGVRVPHRAVANFLAAMRTETGLGMDERLVAVTTLSFDIAVLELLLPLATGAMVVLAPRETAADGGALVQLLTRSRATIMQATPATWRLLVEAGWQPRRNFKILCGGESLAPDLAADLLARSDFVLNLYGPTETTVWSTCARIEAPIGKGVLPAIHVGRPIANTQVWITDAHQQLLPVGVPGEICIGGSGVTLGYLARPELTADRFVPDRFAADADTDALLYRTGDRGRWRADGMLEHLGRLDGQVKVRGFRIELGEVEVQAQAIDAVTRAVAVVREIRPGDARLVLYLVSPRPLQAQDVLDRLRAQLPEYMLPQHVVQVDAVPLLPNGKIDRASLPAPQSIDRGESEPPRNDLERLIARTMEEVLGIEGVGIHDDFFNLGGHSLLAGQLIARLNRKLGANLAWRALFDAPTVARLARNIGLVEPAADAASATIPRSTEPQWAPLTVAQDRLRQLQELSPGRTNFNLPTAHRLSGLLDRDALDRAYAAFAQRHSVLHTVIVSRDGVPMQHVLPESRAVIEPTVDLSGFPPAEREGELARHMAVLSSRCFDIASEPPFCAALFKLEPERHVLFLMGHHILWDGWSFQLQADEMAELYASFHEGRAPVLPELPASFGDYAQWHNEWVQGPQYAAQRRFWQDSLAIGRDAPRFPHDKPVQYGTTGRARVEPLVLDNGLAEALRREAQRHDATLFMALLSVLYVVLHQRVGPGELVVGTPVRGRNHADVEHLAGFFTSLLPLRTAVDEGMAFSALLAQVRSVVLDGFSHPDVLLEDVIPVPTGRRGQGGNLYHALLSYQNARGRNPAWGNLLRERMPLHPPTTAEDLGLWFVEDERALWGELIYNDDVLLPSTVKDLQRRFIAAVGAVADDPGVPIRDLLALLDGGSATQSTVAVPPVAVPATVRERPPSTPAELLLADLFGELFGLDDVGPDDNFFELGGNSLLALKLIKRVEDATGVRFNLIRLASGTVGSLARDLPLDPAAMKPDRGRGSLWRTLFGRAPV